MATIMIKRVFFGVFVFCLLCFFYACENMEEESPIIVHFTPDEPVLQINSNKHLLITVEAESGFSNLSLMRISKKDNYYGNKVLVDSVLDSKKLYYELDYVIPEYPDSTEILIAFSFLDDLGNSLNAMKKVLVNEGASMVSESSGHVVYSSLSGKLGAFNLAKRIPLFGEEAEVDFYDNTIDSLSGNTLSREWIGKNGTDFVLYNGFNYALVNSLTISDAYHAGIKLTKASNIQDNNVYLIGKMGEPVGVIQIINVTDSDSTLNDKYIFNLKVFNEYLKKEL